MIAKRNEIDAFVTEFKTVARETGIELKGRDKNNLAKLGLTQRDFQSEVLSLTYKNYRGGPEAGKDFPREEVWVFGKDVRNGRYYIRYYIKLKVTRDKGAVCISFHPAERTMYHPRA